MVVHKLNLKEEGGRQVVNDNGGGEWSEKVKSFTADLKMVHKIQKNKMNSYLLNFLRELSLITFATKGWVGGQKNE